MFYLKQADGVCVRNDLGRELTQSDSLLSHTFSTVVSYKEVILFAECLSVILVLCFDVFI